MKSEKVCPVCNGTFTPEHNNQIYCSLICQAEGRKEKRSAWYAAHPGYMREYMRDKRIKERDS